MLGLLMALAWAALTLFLSVRRTGPEAVASQADRAPHRLRRAWTAASVEVVRPALLLAGIGLVPLCFAFGDGCTVTVPAAHVAAIYDPLRGGIQNEVLPEGLHFVMPWWQTRTFSQQTQNYTMSGTSHGAGEEPGLSDDAIRCQTNEGLNVNIDCTVLFHVDPARANAVWQNIGRDVERLIVRPYAQSVLRMVVARYSTVDVYSARRKEIETDSTQMMKPLFAEKGIVLEQILIRNVAYGNPAFADAINAKQVAQQQVQTEEQKLDRARIQKQTIIAEARGEAEAIARRGATLRANPEVVQYEYVQKIAPNLHGMYLPAGSLPVVKGGH